MYAKAPHPKKALKAETLCGASTFFFLIKKTTLEHDSVKPLIKITYIQYITPVIKSKDEYSII